MKKLVTTVLAAAMVFTVSAQSVKIYQETIESSVFEDLGVENSTQMSDADLEVLLRSIIKSELEADATRQNDDEKKMQAEIDKQVAAEMKKYRAASDEYIEKLTADLEKKTEDEILDIKTNYALKLAEEKAKMKDEYEGKLQEQRALSDLALLEALDSERANAEAQRLADLEKLQNDMELKQDQKDNPYKYPELFITFTNEQDKGKVSVSGKKTKYNGENYDGITLKGNTGKPVADWASYYVFVLTGNALEDSIIRTQMNNANCIKFKVLGDGQPYKVSFKKGEGSYYYAFNTKKGEVSEFKIHTSEFTSWNNTEALKFKDVQSVEFGYEYGLKGSARPENNKNFEATFFDIKFETDSALDAYYSSMKDAPILYTKNLFTDSNKDDNAQLTVLDTMYKYEGKEYKAINFLGNTGTPVGKNNSWYTVRMGNWLLGQEEFQKFITKGKTAKFKVLGDGNTYTLHLGMMINDEYYEFSTKFSTKKGKVTEVKIPLAKMRCWQNKKLDMSKVFQMGFAYEWNSYGNLEKPAKNKNFNITIFDFVIF